MYLPAGINQVSLDATTNDESDAVNLDHLEVTGTTGTATTYEAESAANTLSGTAARANNSGASGGQAVGFIGRGAANTLSVNQVQVPTAGDYTVITTYANNELATGGAGYNTNTVDRFATVSANGTPASRRTAFRHTGGWSTFRTTSTRVTLRAGVNTLTFANTDAYVADIDKIVVAPTTS